MIKKLKSYYLISSIFRILFCFGFCIISINFSYAKQTNLKEQSDEIAKILRCMTCQNLTIYESDTEFSKQIKLEIQNQLKNGETKEQIISFMIERYGNYILLKPQFNKMNLLLWLLPFVLLVSSFAILLYKSRKF